MVTRLDPSQPLGHIIATTIMLTMASWLGQCSSMSQPKIVKRPWLYFKITLYGHLYICYLLCNVKMAIYQHLLSSAQLLTRSYTVLITICGKGFHTMPWRRATV